MVHDEAMREPLGKEEKGKDKISLIGFATCEKKFCSNNHIKRIRTPYKPLFTLFPYLDYLDVTPCA
jgi:hypothetical protein